ncbi:MAG TPA: DegT/DnrJ/EryC1/StrS family aminotransferase [Candidatus Paceibacterota bacterium]
MAIKQNNKKYNITLAKPWFDDQEAKSAAEVVASRWLISGTKVEQFEKEFAKKINVKYAVAVGSGSDALLIAQQALGVTEGDEVIVPNMTFISTATSSMYLCARPVFADIELKTYGMDPKDIEKRITKKTKGIIPVHYAGQSCDLSQIIKIAKKHGLFVLEDAAEAHLAKHQGRYVGGIGDVGIFSFTPSKPMTTGEGGMITTNSEALARKCKLIRNFHDVGKFEWSDLGFHFRMPEMMGAIGLVQLKKLSKAITKRHKIAARYNKAFEKETAIVIPFVRNKEDINFQLYTIRLNLDKLNVNRDEFINELELLGIQSRLYYPCLHRQGVFKVFGKYNDTDFPNTVNFAKTALSLPIYPDLSNDEADHIIYAVKQIINRHKK